MTRLVTDGGLGLECELGRYFETLDSCDALLWELLSTAGSLTDSKEDTFRRLDANLPLRSSLGSRVTNPVRDGACRSAAVGISTLIAYYDEGASHLMIRRRSARTVPVHAGLLQVVPSFMFQPVTVDSDREYSVTYGFYREYLEELFNGPEAAAQGERDWRYFENDARLRYLKRLLKHGHATLYLSGIAVNLMNLRPEICTLLLVRADRWFSYHSRDAPPAEAFHFNVEYADAKERDDQRHPATSAVRYGAEDEELMRTSQMRPDNAVPPGAAAFWLGVDVLREVLPDAGLGRR
jgi:hypothetical protein